MESPLFMDKFPVKCCLSIKSALFMDNPSERFVCVCRILAFRRSLIQRWLIRKGIPRIRSLGHADFSFFYNDSIFFIMYGGSDLPGFLGGPGTIWVSGVVWSWR